MQPYASFKFADWVYSLLTPCLADFLLRMLMFCFILFSISFFCFVDKSAWTKCGQKRKTERKKTPKPKFRSPLYWSKTFIYNYYIPVVLKNKPNFIKKV